ncbi:cell division protein DedD [Serratia odorifera]|uniref:Cell division protein DedD n=2 Tax=Serratia odorifera TaxID=618 RepID=D4E3L0_SEROD|nr:cell division protein DedD [Serratia odorifera]EFE95558.1 sporulation and cell division repeat protein [Serratia odorifera DSM 4582]PNK90278.1 SPOR domain-containing protein [Serratia odorifera]RII71282.1 cell division protein DedD [Serratia odorifera]VDZ60224.1 cell division protein DedD [Serratia odorifera]
MASKFQNRLVGTVILVALGVIILPGLLDGKKKHYEDEFAAIPLVPKPGDAQENDVLPPVSQPLPAQPPEGAGALVEQQAANEAATQQAARQSAQQQQQNTAITPPPIENTPAPQPKPKPQPKPEVKPQPTPKQETKPAEEKTPAGQAYVVQLGALKNAAKVNEIVATLRLSGYRAFTVPSTPVQGQITRIYVGPDASKQKLQSSLSSLNSLSGLNGQVKPYSVR